MTEVVMCTTIGTPRCLPVSEWPELDRELWIRAREKGGLLDEPRPAAGWASTTQEAVAKAYGRWLDWLRVNAALDPLVPPAQRATFERIKAYVSDLQTRNAPNTVHMRILHLGRMLDVMAPGSKPDWFARVLRQLRAARRPMRDDRARLIPARDLLALGWTLIDQAEQQTGWSPHRRALHYRDGLLILFLCACPLRARNLSTLGMRRHLARRRDCWWVSLGQGSLKNRHRSAELPLPAAFTEAIDRYIELWRPSLLERQKIYGAAIDSERFWLSESGLPMKPKQFHELLDRVIHRELARRFGPHMFRKVAATELAIHDPEHVRIARPLLTHAKLAAELHGDLATILAVCNSGKGRKRKLPAIGTAGSQLSVVAGGGFEPPTFRL